MKPTLRELKGKTYSSIIMIDFNILLLIMGRTTRKKLNKETMYWKNMIDQLDLIGIYRTLHPMTVEYTFSQVHMEHSPG